MLLISKKLTELQRYKFWFKKAYNDQLRFWQTAFASRSLIIERAVMLPDNPNEAPLNVSWKVRCRNNIRDVLDYFLLLKRNPRYSLYLVSHLCQHIGDWFIRIAALLAIEQLTTKEHRGTALSILVLTKTIPTTMTSHIGGVLADALDRRHVMIALDTLGAIVTLGYILALNQESLPMFYVVSALRTTIHSIYEPSTKAIVPMMVPNPHELKRAMTLNGLCWSVMSIVGGVIAGQFSASIGVGACYVLDSATYFLSAIVICCLRGNYNATMTVETTSRDLELAAVKAVGPVLEMEPPPDASVAVAAPPPRRHIPAILLLRCLRCVCSPFVTFGKMAGELLGYLWRSGFGALVCFKATGALIWGPADILNVAFATIENDSVATSKRLGNIFSCVGLGCLIGPLFANMLTDPERPKTLQAVCVMAMAVMMLGWIGVAQVASVAASSDTFALILVFTTIRNIGTSIVWVNSTLILQELSHLEMLGRVVALEYSLAEAMDALTAALTGRMQDAGVPSSQIASGAATVAGTCFVMWSIYHAFGKGAARPQFNSSNNNGSHPEGLRSNKSCTDTPTKSAKVVFT